MKVALLGEAWDIVQRQPQKSEFIFPYNSTSVTAGFQRVRSKLGLRILQYHDLRREGASRLFEAGFSIEEVAGPRASFIKRAMAGIYRTVSEIFT